MAGAVTNSIWNKISSMGLNTTFTGPELRSSFQNVPAAVFYNRLAYLMKIGVLDRTGTYSTDNFVVWRVKNITLKPSRVHYFYKTKSYPGKAAKTVVLTNGAAPTKSPDMVSAIDRMATELNEMLKVAKDNVLGNYSMKDLLDEVSRRTSIS